MSLAVGITGCASMVSLLLNQVWLFGGVTRVTQGCYPRDQTDVVVTGVDPVCFNPSVLRPVSNRPQSLSLSIYLLTGLVIPVTQPFILVSPVLVGLRKVSLAVPVR
ncbi:hypothetical protein [Tropheryma whipplei]|uniref:hypothetical protein n=1 Tax=Tropheryma whipplei TaxID=2039 RepID=UPI0004B60AFC|nr:hypothetical protein [Tropheryma whipplei]